MTPERILQVEDVTLSFGGTTVLDQVEFDVLAGEIRAIIGPNGAGKTSMLNCISGFYRPQRVHPKLFVVSGKPKEFKRVEVGLAK